MAVDVENFNEEHEKCVIAMKMIFSNFSFDFFFFLSQVYSNI